MDNGVRFVLDNFEKSINICKTNKNYTYLLGKIKSEYNIIKYIKTTGNMIEHFDKFKNGKHKYAGVFDFLNNYDVLTNEQLSKYLRNNYREETGNLITFNNIKEGTKLSHSEIIIYFGGSTRGAVIRRCVDKNIFLLVLDDNRNIFKDDGTILFNYKAAKANRDKSKNLLQYKKLHSSIYVFRKIARNQYQYYGEYNIRKNGVEKDGTKHIELQRSTNAHKNIIEHNSFSYVSVEQSKDAKYLKEPTKAERKKYKTNSLYRNQQVSNYTKNRALGRCDLCGMEAPFKNVFGQPYLECHHVIYIANNGPDRIYNTVALCPNCHKEVHELGDLRTKEKLIKKIRDYLIKDNDIDNIKSFNKLFGYTTDNNGIVSKHIL